MIDIKQGDNVDLIKELKDESIDAIITDPPYGINKAGILNDDSLEAYYKMLPECYRVLKNDSVFATFASIKRLPEFFMNNPFDYKWQYIVYINNGMVWDDLGANRYMPVLIFQKGKPKIKSMLDVYECSTSVKQCDTRVHPTQKRLDVLLKLVNAITKIGDTILDPFMGSGTTGVASLSLRRNFIGYELDKTYFERAKERLENTNVVINKNGKNGLEEFEVEND